MTEGSKNSLEKFIAACDELITCKFLVAESKIEKILACLAETPPVYELVSECMEQFNRDREISKAFVQDSKGNYMCLMPKEEYKIIALTFCMLADINADRIDFTDYVKRFFDNGEGISPFKNFISTMILPFRNLICEAFGYPTIELSEKIVMAPIDKVEEEENQVAVMPERQLSDGEQLAKVCEVSKRIVAQILQELEPYRRDRHVDDLKSICYALIMACEDQDFDCLRGLTIGLKYASKGVRAIKFLVRELDENVEEYLVKLTDLNN